MTPEEKQLLVKDLCARLPYKVKVAHIGLSDNMPKVWDLIGLPAVPLADIIVYRKYRLAAEDIENIRPYLRPMSSMTEEEKEELLDISSLISPIELSKELGDLLLSHHLDFRGLIPMGLALEALDGMYKTE